ncbi:MAG: hypothetical protein JXB47_00220 [Anaerolineae bacterium]|nr:hypothetical protein [Anaerolineae bacterium]
MAQTEKPIQRQQDVWDIGNLWIEGESCALVGVGSSGKSRLIQSFLTERVQRFVFGDDSWEKYLIVYVDGNGLLEDTAWGLYEEMLDSAMSEVSSRAERAGQHPVNNVMYQELYRYHKAVLEQDEKLAYRWISRAVSMLFREGKFKCIVFMLDDIDRLLHADILDPMLFRHLKSLRDHNKYHLCYVVSTRKSINTLAGKRLGEIDGFYKLVKANTYPIGVYSHEDAVLMLQGLMARSNFELRLELQRELIRNSGCHPGLLRVAYFALIAKQNSLEKQLGFSFAPSPDEPLTWYIPDEDQFRKIIHETLVAADAMREECYSIWHGLSEDERVVLTRITVGSEPFTEHVEAIGQLKTKKLLLEQGQNPYVIFSPVFEALVPWLSKESS